MRADSPETAARRTRPPRSAAHHLHHPRRGELSACARTQNVQPCTVRAANTISGDGRYGQRRDSCCARAREGERLTARDEVEVVFLEVDWR